MKSIIVILLITVGVIWISCSKQASNSSDYIIKIYLVSLDGTKMEGKPLDCNDRLIEISKSVKVEKTPLESAITELITTRDTEELKNFVKGINLMVFQVTVAGGIADVYLNGEFTINGKCDISRLREQLNETAKQFEEIKKVNFFINSQPLETYLNIAGQGF